MNHVPAVNVNGPTDWPELTVPVANPVPIVEPPAGLNENDGFGGKLVVEIT